MESIIAIIRKSLDKQQDVSNCTEGADAYGHYFDYDGGPEALEDRCVFDGLPDDEKTILLHCLFACENARANFGSAINVELAKLAAKNGRLVRDEAERCLYEGFEEEHWIGNFLRVAYFGSDICYEKRLVDLIEKRAGDCGDGYDGLFMACWFMNSPLVDAALAAQLTCWLEQDTLDRAGCSLTDVFRLVCKWEEMGRNAKCGRMREVYRDYIQRRGDVAYFKKVGLW